VNGSPVIIETHAHLDDEQFASDLPEVIARGREAGVTELLTVGTDLTSSRRAVGLAREIPGVRAVIGISPHEARTFSPETLDGIERLARESTSGEVVAVGEIGLDFRPHLAPPDVQRTAFRAQLELAGRLSLPVSLHVRAVDFEEVLSFLRREADRRDSSLGGVAHCFGGPPELAEAYGELGLAVAFGGAAPYPGSAAARESLAAVPDKRLLVEPACPYLPPQSKRGKRCEPSDIREVVALAAELRGISFADAARVATANARRIFRLPPPPDGAARVLV